MSSELAIPEVAESQFSTALSILQRSDGYDEKISLYLSFRACYFSIQESLKMAGASKNDLLKWYEDKDFNELDTKMIKDFQKLYGKIALTIQYTRNFRLIIEKDAEVISKSLDPEDTLSKFEEQYLNRLRGTYSPEQLTKLASAVQDGDGKAPMNFLQVVMMANSQRSAKVGESQVSKNHDIIEISPTNIVSIGDNLLGEVCPG